MKKELIILPVILLALLTAIWSGWVRIGWTLPLSNAAAQHGAIMVGSFLSTLIFLERAVSFKNKWVLLLPAVNGASIIAFLLNKPLLAQGLLIAGSAGFMAMCFYFIYRYKELYYYVFFAGAFCLFAGNLILFKTHFYPNAVTWWMGFLLFTIVAERLELSRFLAVTPFKRNLLVGALISVLIALFWSFHAYGNIVLGLTFSAVAFWLLKYDMAWHSIRIKGQHRYSGLLLLMGFGWLVVCAVFFMAGNRFVFSYDAALHSFFIGFVFSMIFSHAPIILPAVLKLPIKLFRPILYVWFGLLQLSLVLRIIADVAENVVLRKTAGLFNGIAILLFFVTVGVVVRQELQKQKQRQAIRQNPVAA